MYYTYYDNRYVIKNLDLICNIKSRVLNIICMSECIYFKIGIGYYLMILSKSFASADFDIHIFNTQKIINTTTN